MSSNLQSQQTDMAPAAPPVHDRAKMIEQFVKELVVDRDFKLDKSGNIVMIRQLHVSKCTVSLLRQICVRFKVSGYKNQNKERTLGLLKNLVTRESLKNRMYDESASCFSEESSSQEEDKAADVLATCTPLAGNVTSTLLLSPEGQSSAGSTCDHDNTLVENNDSVEEYHDAEQEELPSYSNDEDYAARASSLDISIQKKRKATRNMSTSSNSDHDNTMKKKNGADLSDRRKKRNTRPSKKAHHCYCSPSLPRCS